MFLLVPVDADLRFWPGNSMGAMVPPDNHPTQLEHAVPYPNQLEILHQAAEGELGRVFMG